MLDPVSRIPDFDDESEDREYAHRLSAQFHRQRVGDRPRRPSQEYHHADLRRVRGVAADRKTRPSAGDVSFPVGLHRQGGGHGERRHRAASDVFNLLRRAVPAAPSDGLRQSSARHGRAPPCRLLARQHRVDRGQVWRRKAHADPGDASPGGGRARRLSAIAPISAPIPISASPCRRRFQASSPTSSNRSRPGATRPNSPKSPAASSRCSATISSASRPTPTNAFAPPAQRHALSSPEETNRVRQRLYGVVLGMIRRARL